ncbi:murein biosynthesis integral membrane protein MurJ [Micromonospora wenchangensis]|uniref:Murein biosynthesis integral membrane protein MurJ n=1 Tax=Micromonospora wenchangensis TaxID=1185415 RepID=A0A246RP31_9ACTN|nr:murein biosynthesis integral membrane protein MurJ [Micromonospora wenchangensis]OWV09094.1 murein biosynthesis integral membrane protein MurJ [Micromonospora wenchangensis]
MSGGLYRSANAAQGGDGPRPYDDGATFISAEPLNQPGVEATAPPQEVVAETSAAANSAVMAVGSLVSRGTGFIRNLMIGAALGSAVGDAFTTAQFLPNQVYEFLLGGVLTSVLIPVLVRRRKADPDRGEAYAQRLLTLAVLALAVTVVLALLLASTLTTLYAGGKNAAYTGLVTNLSYLMLPMLFFTGVSALIAAVLNTRGHFAAPMWAPILNNLVVIGTFGLYIAVYGARALGPEEIGWDRILLVGGGTLLGVAVQAAGLLPALRKVGFRWKLRFDFRELGLRELARLGGWMFCYVAVNQLGLFVVVNLLTRAAGGDENNAGLLIYNNVFLLLMMAHGIIAVSIITALMPRMSAAAAEGRFADVTADLSRGTRMVTAVLAPIAVCYAVLAGPVSVVVFRYGAFTGDNALATSLVLLVAALGLVPFAISQLFTFAFYALPDTRTPALVNIPVVILRVAVQIGVFVAFSATFAAAGMMLGNAISYVAAAVLSAMLLRPRVGRIGLGRIMRTMGKVLVAALGAALVGLLVVNLLPGDPGNLSWTAAAVRLVLGGVVIGGTYLGLAMVLRIGEITEVVAMVRRRLGR